MKRAVIRAESAEGVRCLIVADATQRHLSIRDLIDSALIGDIVGDDAQIRTLTIDDGTPPFPGPDELDTATEAIVSVLQAEGDLTATGVDALNSALAAMGRIP